MKKHDKLPITVSLVIPVYNNEQTLARQLHACLKIMEKECRQYEVIVSNDASTDNSEKILRTEFAKEKKMIIFSQKKNLGISTHMRFLYKKAKMNYILLFSVDGGWNPADIGFLIRTAYNKQADIVIGERMKKAYSFSRHIISSLYNNLPYILFGVKTYDTGSIKIFKREIFTKIPLKSKSIFFEAEMLIKADRKGYKIDREPVTHLPGRKKKSGVNKHLLFAAFSDLIKLKLQGV